MKNPSIRIIPARENLRRVHGEGAADLDVSSIDLMLRMMNAGDVVKGVIFDELKASTGLSEGKFTMMMCLREEGKPLSIGDISQRIGVAPPTVSVMVARMVGEKKPLIVRRSSKKDARSSLVEPRRAGASRQGAPRSFPARGGVCRAPHVRGEGDAHPPPLEAHGAFREEDAVRNGLTPGEPV